MKASEALVQKAIALFNSVLPSLLELVDEKNQIEGETRNEICAVDYVNLEGNKPYAITPPDGGGWELKSCRPTENGAFAVWQRRVEPNYEIDTELDNEVPAEDVPPSRTLLQLWYLRTIGRDHVDRCIVRAIDEQHARRIAASNCGDEGPNVWLDYSLSGCIALSEHGTAGLVLSTGPMPKDCA